MVTDRAAWLHTLTADQIAALYAFRRYARQKHPDADNAMAVCWDGWDVGGVIKTDEDIAAVLGGMPREFVVSLDRGK